MLLNRKKYHYKKWIMLRDVLCCMCFPRRHKCPCIHSWIIEVPSNQERDPIQFWFSEPICLFGVIADPWASQFYFSHWEVPFISWLISGQLHCWRVGKQSAVYFHILSERESSLWRCHEALLSLLNHIRLTSTFSLVSLMSLPHSSMRGQ